MRKKCVRWTKSARASLFAAATILVLPFAAAAQTADPSTLPLLTAEGIEYKGAFRLPAQSSNGDSFAIGGRALVYSPATNTLFVGSRAGRVAEISIPGLGNSSDPNALPFASYLQPFADPMEGHLSQVASDGVALDGLMIVNNRLVGTASVYYDANNDQRKSHFSRSLQLNQPSFAGWSSVWDPVKTGFVSGAMAAVPVEWQSKLGGTAITGQCCIPIVSRTSWGPAAFAFDPSKIGTLSTIPAQPLLYYTGDHHTLGNWENQNATYGSTTAVGGVAIIAGTRTVLYFGRNGIGPACYGNGTGNSSLAGTMAPDGAHYCYDPTDSSKGTHGYPYRYQIWAYDLNDFVAVREGRKQPWDVIPYGVWPLSFPTAEPTTLLGGVGYDPVHQTVYVSQMLADRDGYEYRALIHAFQLNAFAAPSAPPVPPTGGNTGSAPVPPATGGTVEGGVISSISLAVNRNAPQNTGTAITFTAAASGGVVPYQYKFLVYDGTGWTPVTSWSQLNAFTWTPSTASADYRVGVWARSAGNTRDEPEASASSPFPITAPAPVLVSAVTLSANKVAPQTVGTSVTWTAAATGGVAPVQYKWLVYDANGWAQKTGWTTSNTFAWTPTAASSEYRVGVWVRGANNTAAEDAFEVSTQEPFAITGAAASPRVTAVTVGANKIAPQTVGSTITATATVTGGVAPYNYKWFIYSANTGWTAVSGWTASNTFAWTPTHVDAEYQIGVWVRSAGNTNDELEASGTLLFPIK